MQIRRYTREILFACFRGKQVAKHTAEYQYADTDAQGRLDTEILHRNGEQEGRNGGAEPT
ncbi:hypothetical protein D3C75_1387100 [compost metagenome]